MADLEAEIDALWERRDDLDVSDEDAQRVVREAVALLDAGEARVAKRAILLLFKLSQMETIELGPFEFADKIPLKSAYEAAGVRVVPGASARWGAFLDRGVVMMPSYVNIGAYVGAGSMVDTWATVGSCAQIGKNVHLSGGVGIGGVLEPPQAAPVMIGDDAFIGSRCMVVEGARVGEGAKLGAGVILSSSVPVFDAETGEQISRGEVPPWCVAIQASRSREFAGGTWGLPCVLVISRLEPGQVHDKLTLESVLREHGAAV